jgi:hypothetical protein
MLSAIPRPSTNKGFRAAKGDAEQRRDHVLPTLDDLTPLS